MALALADFNPERVDSITLLHSHGYADNDQKKRDRLSAIKIVRHRPELLINEMIPNLFAPVNLKKLSKEVTALSDQANTLTREGVAASLGGMRLRPDRTTVIEKLGKPVQIILGKLDPVMDYNVLKKQFKLKGVSDKVTLKKSGHMGFLEEPRETLYALEKFLESVFISA